MYQRKQPLALLYEFFIKIQKSILKNTLYDMKNNHNRVAFSHEKNRNTIRIEIDSEKVWILFAQHQICIEDLYCLDNYSKQQLKSICLKTSLLRKKKGDTAISSQAKSIQSGELM
ncbi:MAG: hypothetical protein KAG10_02750 [Methylococcales bacterium]|nr:hypothetical protein [Methylococcales bacterium]MCK5898096.1 hypothetical protein [Methylococcales bacterium]MCK5924792.1 hypothetical protein [Methylococcales bacterium]